MKRASLAPAVLMLLLGGAGQASADLVVNGSFEQVPIGPPFKSANLANVPGWTHGGFVGEGPLWAIGYTDGGGGITVAGAGRQFVTLGSGFGQPPQTSSWQQTLTGLTPGGTYHLAFDMASEADFAGSQSITVDFPAGSSAAAQTFTSAPGGHYWTNWVPEGLDFIATDPNVTLRFSATTTADVGLDAVSVTPLALPVAVPEPTAFALFGMAALGAAGYYHRRRRKRAAA